jgi:nicotinate-nucleotide pyrophosphorylase (carboxylating)
MTIKKSDIHKIISTALKEDIQTGDVTTNLIIPSAQKGSAYFMAKEDGIIAGLPIAKEVFKMFDKKIVWKNFVKEGSFIKRGTRLAEVKGSLRTLLSCERTALNLLQRISGIATLTYVYVDAVKNTNAKILDTRKTAPGLRLLDKYAVKTGGGTNHRFGLYDMVLIKDNHIKAAGSIEKAVDKIKTRLKKKIKIEVETTNIDEVRAAIKANVDIIMLDNMTIKAMKDSVKIIGEKIKTEASGNVNLNTVRAIAETGVDFISIGALTHSVKALDISMKIN